MAIPNKKGASKSAPKSASKAAPVNAGKSMMNVDSFPVIDGIPRTHHRATPEQEARILNTLSRLKPGKNHGEVPSTLKSATKRLVEKNFPSWDFRTSYNKKKHIVRVWRNK